MNNLLDLSLSDIDTFDNVVKLLNSGSENRVANAMELFSKVPFAERCCVYDTLYQQIPFTHTYWGCAEDAFHDQNGLRTTPEQKAQAIQSYLSRLIAAAILNPSDLSTISKVTHFILGKCVDYFKNGPTKEGMELFTKMPKEQQEKVYNELNKNHAYQGCTQDVFYEVNGQRFTPEQKAQGIQNYLIQNIADLLKSGNAKSVQTGLSLFNRMSKEQREGIFEELYKLNTHTHEYWGCAEDSFYDRNGQSSTVLQKAEAMQNYLTGKRPAQRTPVLIINGQVQSSPDEQGLQRVEALHKAQEQKELQRREEEARQKKESLHLEQVALQQKESLRLEQVARQKKERLRLEQVAQKKLKNISSLDQKCIASSDHYYDEPVLEIGQCLIRQATTHCDTHPNYTLIFRLPNSNKNDRIWITVDNETGDFLGCGSSFPSLDELLINYSVKPVAEFPLPVLQDSIGKRLADEPKPLQEEVLNAGFPAQDQQDFIDDIEKRFLAEMKLYQQQMLDMQAPVIILDEPNPLLGQVLIATELKLSSEELAFEQDQAEELFEFGKRSILSHSFISQLSNYKKGGLKIRGENLYSAITGCTQNFSTTHLASCGRSLTRELLILDPNNSPILAMHYTKFRQTLDSQLTTKQVLEKLMGYVRKEIFLPCNNFHDLEAKVIAMVEKAAATHPTVTHAKYPGCRIPMISIDDFIKANLGVCRHHALVTVYLLDRLLTETNPLIEGTVQHIRGNLDGSIRGGHIWTTFIPKHTSGASLEKWHLDTYWDRLVNFADDEALKKLKRDYGIEMMDDQIRRTHKAAEKNCQIPQPLNENNSSEPAQGYLPNCTIS